MSIPYTPEQVLAYKLDNERRVREAAARGDVFVDGMPLKVTMELTADCNFFCRMCEFPVPREDGRKKGYDLHMKSDLFDLLAPQVLPHALMVNLTVVGEPLMVPYLDRVIAMARDWQTRIEFITNGQLLDDAMIERIGPIASAVVVSFDGGTRRTFNRIRVGGDFDVITCNMLRFDRWRRRLPEGAFVPDLHMNVTLMRENVEELPTIVRVAHLLNVDRVNAAWMIAFTPKMAQSSCFQHRALANAALRRARAVAEELGVSLGLPAEIPGPDEAEIAAVRLEEPELPDGPLPHLREMLAGGAAPEIVPAPAGVEEAFHEYEAPGADLAALNAGTGARERDFGSPLQQSADEKRLQAQLAVSPPPSAPRTFEAAEPHREGARYTCKFLWNELFVNISGDVAPCCIQGRPIVGSVLKESLDAIWNGPQMREMRQRLLEGDPIPCCKDCNYNTQLGQGAYREDTFFIQRPRRV
jgi:MoaA/NifB/PqqE/SkfB family radical SAM enzyme